MMQQNQYKALILASEGEQTPKQRDWNYVSLPHFSSNKPSKFDTSINRTAKVCSAPSRAYRHTQLLHHSYTELATASN